MRSDLQGFEAELQIKSSDSFFIHGSLGFIINGGLKPGAGSNIGSDTLDGADGLIIYLIVSIF
ncbi:hypothetical protein [Sphingorhabdus sp. M41]|uniref:hypothetical protein n=1 Tax=Sphingorhabdus sp. M41 TaxID=1806885 RepID=UPI00078CEF7D|nr:hypothetical protein [Sphingorhabdus sp. M41]AMO72087.1 hypothetical protein AZE99_09735 [Sphingorhabdus sp. M41]